MSEGSDDAEWARANRACFELNPLVELRDGQKIQVGFTVDLYAGLPTDKSPGADRQEKAAQIFARLRALVESLAPPEDTKARVEIEPPRTAAFFRPENKMDPEIGLRARVFHSDDYFAAVTTDERARLSAVTQRLVARGLRAGHW